MFLFCLVTDLHLTGGELASIPSHNLTIKWGMLLGTNVTVIICWGDQSENETITMIQANATSPFSTTNSHNYPMEGEYKLRLEAFNNFSKQALQRNVFVQLPIPGFVINVPSRVLRVSERAYFNISLTVLPKFLPLVSWTFGDGYRSSTNNYSISHSYGTAGVFTVAVQLSSKVNCINSTVQMVTQETISGLTFDRNTYFFARGRPQMFYMLISKGTNITGNITLGNSYNTIARIVDLNVDGYSQEYGIAHTFSSLGVLNMLAAVSNLVSTQNATARVVVEVPIQGLNMTVTCHGSGFSECFINDTIIIQVSFSNGSNPRFIFDNGNGSVFASMDTCLQYKYMSSGSFILGLRAYNNISSSSISNSLVVAPVIPLSGLKLSCNESVRLSNLTECRIIVTKGTAYECSLSFGDGTSTRSTYLQLPAVNVHNYTTYGTYFVKLRCNNSLGFHTAQVIIRVTIPAFDLEMTSSDKVISGDALTLKLKTNNVEFGSCFLIEFGDGNKIRYGEESCCRTYLGGNSSQIAAPIIFMNHTYTKEGKYVIVWNATNNETSSSIAKFVVVTKGPCDFPNVFLTNIAKSPQTATRMLRSKEFMLRSRYDVNCKHVKGASLHWNINRNVTGEGFQRYRTITSSTSDILIKARTLEYGVYKVELTITLIGAIGVSGSAEGYLHITQSPLIAVIRDGSALRRTYGAPVTLDGSMSRDPDTGLTSGLEFKWHFCRVNSSYPLDLMNRPLTALDEMFSGNQSEERTGCLGLEVNANVNEPLITFTPNELEMNSLYIVKLAVSQGNRLADTTSVVHIAHGNVSAYTIRYVN